MFPPSLVKLDGIEEMFWILYDAMQVSIYCMSVHDFECLTPRFEQHVEVVGNSHGLDCLFGQWQEPLSSVPLDGDRNRYRGTLCLVIPDVYLGQLSWRTSHNVLLSL